MRPISFHAFACAVALVALASALPAGRVDAQCITGPSGLCDGAPIQLCGPPGMLSYEWSGPGVNGNTNQCVTVTLPGRYYVFYTHPVTGDNDCFKDVQMTASPEAIIEGPSEVCSGATAQLTGPLGNFNYAWSGPSGFSATTQAVNVGVAGTYELVVTNRASGCVSQPGTHDLNVTARPTTSISGPTSACAGSSLSLCGPAGNVSYSWSGPGGFSASTQCVSVSVAGTYQLMTTDNASGCVSMPASQSVSFTALPSAAISGPSSVCAGSSVTLSGPSGNFTWDWSGPGGFAATTQSVSVSAAGTYQLLVTDNASGCENSSSRTLSVTARPTASISGPTTLCGTATLTGSSGNVSWSWSGPGGFSASTQSVTVSLAGTYQLVVTDLASGCASQAASHSMALGSAPVASIRGPSETCPGQAAQLCGPEGPFGYAWTGPNGFSADAMCVEAAEAGMYTLILTDLDSGCSAAPISRSVTECVASENCPRPASFWRRAVLGYEHGVNVASVARAVDERANFFKWGSTKVQAYTTVMKGGRGTLANLAARQYAAVWSNVVGPECAVVSRGRPVSLRASTSIRLPGVSTTVGEWLAATDAQLSQLAFKSERERSVRQAYCKIITVGMHVNHGFGIGKVCSRRSADDNAVAGGQSDTESDEMSLEAELQAELGAGEMDLSIEPNPFSSRTRIHFSVASSASSDVQVGVFDLAGRQVRQLARGSFAPGMHEVEWDGRDDSGNLARNGVYFVLTRVNGRKMESRLTLLR